MNLTREQVDELRMGALTAMDGLWFLGLESRYGFDLALEIDIEVWMRYGVVIIKRIARMAGIDLKDGPAPDIHQVKFFLESLCLIDGTKADIRTGPGNTLAYRVDECPWWENLKKSGRHNHPCEMIDDKIFRHWLAVLGLSGGLEVTHSRPRGHEYCMFRIKSTSNQHTL